MVQPVDYKNLRVPKPEKCVTSVQPFKFTEMKFQRKPVSEKPNEVFKFRARPAPKTTAPGTVPIPKKVVLPSIKANSQNLNATTSLQSKHITKNMPKFCEEGNNKLTEETVRSKSKAVNDRSIEIKPFSFEERNKKMQELKELKIKQRLEKENRPKIFHARPLCAQVIAPKVKVESKRKPTEENVAPENKPTFKARPATVIHKKPFVPKKVDRPFSKIQAKEQLEEIKQQREEKKKLNEDLFKTLKKLEDLEIKELRKSIVHKAQPIKNIKPLEIHRSTKPLTSPKTPTVLQRMKKNLRI